MAGYEDRKEMDQEVLEWKAHLPTFHWLWPQLSALGLCISHEVHAGSAVAALDKRTSTWQARLRNA